MQARDDMLNLIERLFAMWNSQDAALAFEIYSEEYCGIDLTNQTRINGPAGVTRQLERFYQALPDLEFKYEQVIFENDRVAVYWSARGTHRGTLLNIPPTGRVVQINGVSWLRERNGKFAHGVHMWDMAALLRAVGLLPELETRAPSESISLQAAFAPNE